MKRILICVVFAVSFIMYFHTSALAANTIYLDADSPETGSLLLTTPLVTPYGTISFSGELYSPASDPEFITAGASGNVFDINPYAELTFSFDIVSAEFIYGGNPGEFDIEARDIYGGVVDYFYQPSTDDGEPAGPITLSGSGIRSLYWQDTQGVYAAIDNVTLTVVPEPISSILFLIGGVTLGFRRFRKRR